MRTAEAKLSLVDTNVLVYAVNPLSNNHEAARSLWQSGLNGEARLCVCPQILFEFYSVVTNPKRFSPARTVAEAVAEVDMSYAPA